MFKHINSGTIVLDVANFSLSAKRATVKDSLVFEQLSAIVLEVSKDDIYDELQRAKANISGLKFDQLLRKDVKVIYSDNIVVAVSAVPLLSCTFLEKYADIGKKVHNFCIAHNYHALIVTGIQIDPQTDTVKRDILVFSTNTLLKNKVNFQLQSFKLSVGSHPMPFISLIWWLKWRDYSSCKLNDLFNFLCCFFF